MPADILVILTGKSGNGEIRDNGLVLWLAPGEAGVV